MSNASLLVRSVIGILLIMIGSSNSPAKPVPGFNKDKTENSCVEHLLILVDSLVLQAEAKGTTLDVRWINRSRVILFYKEFTEILWYDGSVLHGEFL